MKFKNEKVFKQFMHNNKLTDNDVNNIIVNTDGTVVASMEHDAMVKIQLPETTLQDATLNYLRSIGYEMQLNEITITEKTYEGFYAQFYGVHYMNTGIENNANTMKLIRQWLNKHKKEVSNPQIIPLNDSVYLLCYMTIRLPEEIIANHKRQICENLNKMGIICCEEQTAMIDLFSRMYITQYGIN